LTWVKAVGTAVRYVMGKMTSPCQAPGNPEHMKSKVDKNVWMWWRMQ